MHSYQKILRKGAVLLGVFILITATFVQAQVSIISQNNVGGWASYAVTNGDYIYFLQGSHLTILNSSSGALQKESQFPLEAEPSQLIVNGNYLYLLYASNANAIQVLDISNPTVPVHENFVALQSDWPFTGHINGNQMAVAVGEKVVILSLDNPAMPTILAEYEVSANYVYIDGNRLYVANNTQFLILDITNLSNIQQMGSLDLIAVHDIVVQGNTAYLAVINNDNGLTTVDVSDPSHPTVLAREQLKYKVGNSTYILNPQKLIVKNGYAYVGCSGFEYASLFVVDVQTPNNLEVVGQINEEMPSWLLCNSFAMNDSYIYVATGSSGYGLIQYQISDISNPTIAGYYEDPTEIRHLCSENDMVYAAGDERLWAYQVVSQDEQVLRGSSIKFGGMVFTCASMNVVYAVKSDSLFIIDVSDPASMQLLGSYKCPVSDCSYQGVAAANKIVYLLANISGGTSFVEVVDANTPGSPAQLSQNNLPLKGRDLFVESAENRLFVGFGDYDSGSDNFGIKVFDISNNQALTMLGQYKTEAIPMCLWYSDNTLYVGSNTIDQENNETNWSLESLNVTDVNQITQLASTGGTGGIYDVLRMGDYIVATVQGDLEGVGKANNIYDFYGFQEKNDTNAPHGTGSLAHLGKILIFGLNLNHILGCPAAEIVLAVFVTLFAAALWNLVYFSGYGFIPGLQFYGSLGLVFALIGYGSNAVEKLPEPVLQPVAYELSQNYPNPFNPETQIEFRLQSQAKVELSIFDVRGREVDRLVRGSVGPGLHQIRYRADHLPGGIYTYRLNVNGKQEVRKMILLK